MKTIFASAVAGLLLLGAIPASAQVFVQERGDGVVIHRVDREYSERDDRGRHHGWRKRHHGWEKRHHGWRQRTVVVRRNHRTHCQTVRIKTRRANGDVVIRTRRRC